VSLTRPAAGGGLGLRLRLAGRGGVPGRRPDQGLRVRARARLRLAGVAGGSGSGGARPPGPGLRARASFARPPLTVTRGRSEPDSPGCWPRTVTVMATVMSTVPLGPARVTVSARTRTRRPRRGPVVLLTARPPSRCQRPVTVTVTRAGGPSPTQPVHWPRVGLACQWRTPAMRVTMPPGSDHHDVPP
jgi:hypothetical protein